MKTTTRMVEVKPIGYKLPEFSQSLGVGRTAAEKIAQDAKAVVKVYGRRIYLPDKARAYLEELADRQTAEETAAAH